MFVAIVIIVIVLWVLISVSNYSQQVDSSRTRINSNTVQTLPAPVMTFVRTAQDDQFKYSIYRLNDKEFAVVTGTILFDIPQCLCIPDKVSDVPVTQIGEKAFDGVKLNKLLLPESIREIGQFAFSSIRGINITENVKKIGHSAFSYCYDLEFDELHISHGMVVENSAFDGVIIKNLVLESDSRCQEGAFEFAKIGHIEFNYGAHKLSKKEFLYSKIEAVEIPDGVTSIPEACFKNSSLKRILIPSSVTSISQDAFTVDVDVTPTRLDGYRDLRYNTVYSERNMGVTIYCEAGSYAQQYARDRRFEVRPSSEYKE